MFDEQEKKDGYLHNRKLKKCNLHLTAVRRWTGERKEYQRIQTPINNPVLLLTESDSEAY